VSRAVIVTAVAGWMVWAGAVNTAGAADPYRWRITHPDGRVTTGEGRSFSWRALQPGDHLVELTVLYQHQAPDGGAYTYTTTETVHVTGPDLRQVFADGFENGTTDKWSTTTGGDHG
jgi:hypothetical protein